LQKHPGALLDKDTIYGEIVESLLHNKDLSVADMEGEWYDRTLKPLEYRGMFRTAKEIRSYGCDVILSAPFSRQAHDASEWQGLVEQCGGGDVRLLWVMVDLDTLRQRIEKRGEARNAYVLENFEKFVRRTKADELPMVPYVLIQNGVEGTAVLRQQLSGLLDSGPRATLTK